MTDMPMQNPYAVQDPYASIQSSLQQRPLSSAVATASPELFAAASRTSITREDRNLIEGWSQIKNMHYDLMRMSNKDAEAKYQSLDPQTQAWLKQYYNVDYANKGEGAAAITNETQRRLLGLDDGVNYSNAYKSPLRFLLEAAGQYSRVLNMPYAAAQQALVNGASLSNSKVWDLATEGQFNYDENTASRLIEKHGGALSFAAMHILAGMTPGEIIDAWGPGDAEIINAVNTMFNKPEEFQSVLDEFDKAKLSPGRDIARWINKTFNIHDEKTTLFKAFGKNVTLFDLGSGAIDMAFQIFADPMTYFSGGISALGKGVAGLNKAEKLAKALSESRNVAEHFARPEVAKYFTGYTKQIGKYADAVKAGDDTAAAKIQDHISRNYALHGTREEVNLWAASGVKDLSSLISIVDTDVNALGRIIRGRAAGNMYQREGAAYASNIRTLKTNIKNKIADTILGKKGFDVLNNTDIETLAKDLITGGQLRSGSHTYDEAGKFVKNGEGQNQVQKWFNYLSSLHPGNKVVFTNDDAVLKSLDVFRNQAHLLFENKAVAESLTQYFLNSTQAERIAIKRGVDDMTMRKMGIHGIDGGEELISRVLDARYGSFGASTFGAAEKLERPASVKTLSRITQHLTDDVNVMGPLHQYQITEGISSLPYRELSEFASKLSYKDLTKFNAIPKLIGGAFESKVMGKVIDLWSLLTLAPMLGIRTAIDETFFAGLTTKGEVASYLREAGKAGKVLAAYTNDSSATGPIKHLLQKTLEKFSDTPIAAHDSIDLAERQKRMEYHFNKFKKNGYDSYSEAQKAAEDDVFAEALLLFGYKMSKENIDHIYQLRHINPSILQTTSAQNVVDTLLPTRNIINADKPVLSPSQLDVSMRDLNSKATGQFDSLSVANMSDAHVDLAMFKNFWTRFTSGGIKVKGKKIPNSDLGRLFIANNCLATAKDVDMALGQFMYAMGFRGNNNRWVLLSKHLPTVDAFLNSSRHYMQYFDPKLGNYSEAISQIALDAFTDMYHVFHGGAGQFNDKLSKLFDDFRIGKIGDHRSIIRKLEFDDYRALIKDHKAIDRIVTDIDFGHGVDLESGWSKFQNKLFEMMSRQTDDLVRQPVVIAHYFAYRSEYAKWGQKYVPQMTKKLIADGMPPKSAATRAQEMFDRHITEMAMQNAADHVLKYADNPEIRTIFAYNMKAVGRYYRAVEDQWRRTVRLISEHKVGTIYRMRLMQQGLASVGAVHNDANGEPYVIMPMDDIAFSAVNKGLNLLTNGNLGVNQPLFNDLTFKLTAGNPSFQTDAGVPYLSGPAGSLSILAIKSLLGKFDPTKNFAEDLDNAALGDLGDNVSLTSIVTPKIVRSMMKMNTADQNSTEEVSAFTQALCYYQAHNLAPNEEDFTKIDQYGNPTVDMEAFNKAKRKYLDNVRIAAHSIITTRALLGLMLPVSFQGKDFKDLPDYLKHGDVTSMSASFYQVLKEVESKYPDIGDPYEVALATWTGNNPGKLPYLVSKNLNEVKPMLSYSKKMQDWAIANDGAVKTFGNGALIFAPHIGEFNAGVWAWANAADLAPKIPAGMTTGTYLENYFDDLRLRKYTNAYYDTYNQENDALNNIPINFTDERRAAVEHFKNQRKQLQLSVPGLKDYIDSSRDNKANVEFVNQVYDYVNSGIADAPKELLDSANQMYELYQGFMQYANVINQQNYQNGSDIKRAEKLRVLEEMDALIKADTSGALKTFFQYGLQPLMNSVSRDTNSSITRNVIK